MKIKHLLYISLLFLASTLLAEGPKFKHEQPVVQQEFESVYQDIGSVLVSSGSSKCIDPTAFCVDTVNHTVSQSSTTMSGQLLLTGGSVNDASIRYTSDAASWTHGLDNSDSDKWVLSQSNTLGTSNVFVVTTNAEITQPGQPSFLATQTSGSANVTGDGTQFTLAYGNEIFDQGSDYDTGTFTFTAPVTGRYSFCALTNLEQISAAHTTRRIEIVTSNRTYTNYEDYALASTNYPLHLCTYADMDANDTAFARTQVGGSTKTVDVSNDPGGALESFSGSLIN